MYRSEAFFRSSPAGLDSYQRGFTVTFLESSVIISVTSMRSQLSEITYLLESILAVLLSISTNSLPYRISSAQSSP